MGLCERLKQAREGLHLSQDYVAKRVGINRSAVAQIEAGNREVKATELDRFSELYKISSDELLRGKEAISPNIAFARNFSTLDKEDQQEILNLIEFKKAYMERHN